MSWEIASADPSAGVRLVARHAYCPRCGIDKGLASQVRRGLCIDCYAILDAPARKAWAA